MKKLALLLLPGIFIVNGLNAQVPQFAVVRPDGTTYICPSFDSAYTRAVDDDMIYMPGTTISGSKTISKRLTLIGAGHYPDSTFYTGKTVFTGGSFNLEKKCTLEGFEVGDYIVITNANAGNCSFIRIKCNGLFFAGTNDHFIDGSVIANSISGGTTANNSCNTSSNIFIRNSIVSQVTKLLYSNINNCLFLGAYNNWTWLRTANSTFTNCIFRGLFGFDWYFDTPCFSLVGNASNNSIWFNGVGIPGQNNYVTTQPDTLMINSGTSIGFNFDYTYNYHLKPNSPYLTAGDDATPIGIYGGIAPYKEGAVPGNPHIYFKQVSTQTNSNGQLPIQFKVRTNN
jgi:hypothetical protein